MRDKVTLLMEETGCDRGEAELALELCGYDLESAVQAVPRLFQNIAVLKGRLLLRAESLYGLWLVILNLKDRTLLRARAVVSYNPAVFSSELDRHWFEFEGRLYACRLWVGTMQPRSQEIEGLLAEYFDSARAEAFYAEGGGEQRALADLRESLETRLGDVELQVQRDVLDMGQFREVQPRPEGRPRRRPSGSPGPLVLKVALEPDPEGPAAGELKAGDLVYASIIDGRDIARYLARLFGAREGEETRPMQAPVEAIERQASGLLIRIRFSAGLCGDVLVPPDIRLRKGTRRTAPVSWWRKLLGG